MPYIDKDGRDRLDPAIKALVELIKDKNRGELNYIFTKILLAMEPKNYENHNSLIGVLECCKLEYYRRHVVPYEEIKTTLNGDVTK